MSTPIMQQAGAVFSALEEGQAMALIKVAEYLLDKQGVLKTDELIRESYKKLCFDLGYSQEFTQYWEEWFFPKKKEEDNV